MATTTEMEALLLEYNLIQEHRPRYNVTYRDDKSYPYIKVSLAETFPRIVPTRHMVDDARHLAVLQMWMETEQPGG